jgi:GDP-4-dehydro-6-deoxy-D-mannose reductase
MKELNPSPARERDATFRTMSQRILVTGSTGLLGRSLVRFIAEHAAGSRVFGTSRAAPAPDILRLLERHHMADLTSREETRMLVAAIEPDVIVHTASRRAGTLEQLFAANVLATDHLVESVRAGAGGRIIIVGSSAEIGFCDESDLPLAEDARCRPVDHYGVTKLAQSALAHAAHLRHAARIVRLRLFNLTGPHLPPTLLPGRCAQLLAERLGDATTGPLAFGSLAARRDYTDVRDVCRAILLALGGARDGRLYHIGSGEARDGHEVVGAFLKAAAGELGELTYTELRAETPAVPAQIADATLAAAELGWRAEITFEQSVRDAWETARRGVDMQSHRL